jgi:hypothetical protein
MLKTPNIWSRVCRDLTQLANIWGSNSPPLHNPSIAYIGQIKAVVNSYTAWLQIVLLAISYQRTHAHATHTPFYTISCKFSREHARIHERTFPPPPRSWCASRIDVVPTDMTVQRNRDGKCRPVINMTIHQQLQCEREMVKVRAYAGFKPTWEAKLRLHACKDTAAIDAYGSAVKVLRLNRGSCNYETNQT